MRAPLFNRIRLYSGLLSVAASLMVGSLLWSTPCSAKFFSVERIEPGFPENPPFGEIVREIRVEGNKHTRTWIIESALKSQVGHPYTAENAQKDMLWVARLGSFTTVAFDMEPVEDGIALIVIVSEASPYIPSLSFKITQENGVEIGPAVSSMNLFGTAARASAYARFGGATNIGIRYADPELPGRSFLWGYQVYYFHRERTNELLNFNEKTDEVLFEFKQSTNDFMRTGLRFRYLGLNADQPGITLDSDNTDEIPSFGLFVQNDSRNSVYPTDGWFLDLELSKYGIFGGDGDYWRADLDVRRYMGVPGLGYRHSLALSTFATLVSGSLGETVPVHQQFFLGGTNSVRGWTLGSRQGRNQWLTTAEYWYQLMEQRKWKFWFIRWRMGFALGVFGDIGTAWSEDPDLDGNMISGYGAGFRLSLPVITVVRLDLGYGEDGARVRLFVGGAEKADAQKQRVR